MHHAGSDEHLLVLWHQGRPKRELSDTCMLQISQSLHLHRKALYILQYNMREQQDIKEQINPKDI